MPGRSARVLVLLVGVTVLASLLVGLAVLHRLGSGEERSDRARLSGPPVNAYLPWHEVVLDRREKLVAWYQPERNRGYDRVLRLGWDFIKRGVPIDARADVKVYLAYAVIDGDTLQGEYWQHNPAMLYGSFVDSLVPWYAYSGDRRAVRVVRTMLDHQLAHGTTPAGWEWPEVPFPTSCAGELEYGRCFGGSPRRFYGGIEPDKVGLLGLGYTLFYELTGERRYLEAGVRCGEVLARHVRPGDAEHTPWPFRVDGRTGETIDGAEYGGMVVAPVRLLDELVRLGAGDVAVFRRARDLAWRWLLRHPLNPASPAWNRWAGFYEDASYSTKNLNQASPTMTAYYLLTRERPASIDPRWRAHARSVLQWVRSYLGRGPFHGAWGIDEQRAPGGRGCCSPAGLGSDTSRWAAANALYFERTGDPRAREDAYRSLNYATYFARRDGLISCCGTNGGYPYWFSDGYADYLRSFSWTMGAMPELAPRGEDHLLRSSSVVQEISYGRRRVAYHTFSDHAVDVLRLTYRPARVLAGGRRLPLRRTLAHEGYTVGSLAGGDFVVRVRHDRASTVRIQG